MLFQSFAPQRLKCMAASIQGFEFGNIRPFTAQITPLDPVGGYSGVLGHGVNIFPLWQNYGSISGIILTSA
jgi:hypothetical protein